MTRCAVKKHIPDEVEAWTFDENHGRVFGFIDGLVSRKCGHAGEVLPNFRVWLEKPHVL